MEPEAVAAGFVATHDRSVRGKVEPLIGPRDLELQSLEIAGGHCSGSRLLGVAFTFTVTNGGPSGATGVKVTDTLPAGVTLVSDTVVGTGSGLRNSFRGLARTFFVL